MNKPREDEEKDVEGTLEVNENDIQDELDKLDAYKDYQNDGFESLTYGDY